MNLANSDSKALAIGSAEESLAFAILKQFRLIYGSVKQHFREVEQTCGVSGSQLWLLHEIARTPGIGVSELAGRLSIHQSTCSQLVDKLETRGLVTKRRKPEDQRRVGLQVSDSAADVLQTAPGPAEGILPEALQGLSEDELRRLQAGLASVIGQLKTRDERSVDKPLADL
ncbi:MAG: MarR family transcriptional regulator [Proteobacteria bacterium]|nr:MarR family transcriptional regulator [Pseudomonadota bacterium]